MALWHGFHEAWGLGDVDVIRAEHAFKTSES
jgi:hypothetical protein